MVIAGCGSDLDFALLDSSRRIFTSVRRSWNRAPRDLAGVLRTVTRYAQHPGMLQHMSNHQFEIYVAALLWAIGYDVTLTKKTHDGGKDIVAVDPRDHCHRVFVECKRFRPGKRVGVAAVRQLVGTVRNPPERAMKGLLVTAGYFTSAARAYAAQNARSVELRTIDDIKVWMSSCLSRRTLKADCIGVPSPEDDYYIRNFGGLCIRWHESENQIVAERFGLLTRHPNPGRD